MLQFYEHLTGMKRLYDRLTAPVEEKYDLTSLEFNVLMFLGNHPEFDRASDIVNKRGFTKSHVSLAVRSLTNRGLLSGDYLGTDRRTIHLRLAGNAMQIVEEGRVAQEAFGKTLIKGLSEEDLEHLCRCFRQVEKNVKENR